LIGGLVGLFLLICGPYGWAIELIWLPGWFYGVAWMIVKFNQRNEFMTMTPNKPGWRASEALR
jgi:hypothetical protein